jgi:hypothetical protein
VNRPRAADDFAAIRARMEEPRRERDKPGPFLLGRGGGAQSRPRGLAAARRTLCEPAHTPLG